MINESLLRIIAQERVNGNLRGRVATLGRQNVRLSLEETLKILIDEGVSVDPSIEAEIRSSEKDIETRYSNSETVSDQQLFKLLGIHAVDAIDVTDYEGAAIIHNLNYPISGEHHEAYDYIIDGGTFDHLFDVKTAFENVTHLLKVDGTLLMWNGASNFTGAAYLSYAPDFFFDYFIENQFYDVRVYLAELRRQAQDTKYKIFKYLGASKFNVSNATDTFFSPYLQMTIVMATKTKDTSVGVFPVQSFYRPEDRWIEFDEKLDKMRAGKTSPDLRCKPDNFVFRLRNFVIIHLYTYKHRMRNTVFKLLGLV